MWHKLSRRLRRLTKFFAILIGLGVVIMAVTIGIVETKCRAPLAPSNTPFRSALDAADRRDAINSYLSYPEWSIVHAYEDLAGVMRQGSESDFQYMRSISGFWSSLCGVKKLASSRGRISFDFNSMLYVIGVSFTAEMGIKGLYETTIGSLTAWIRGPAKTPEDQFALGVADDYAALLRQVPWYEFPFGQKLARFWADTPLLGGNVIRKLERRIALTLEYGSKALYARVIKQLAGLNPAALRIRSVVRNLDASDVAADNRINIVKGMGDFKVLIETPRYRDFTSIIRGLSARGRDVVEIAGNDTILVTLVVPDKKLAEPAFANPLFAVPIQARAGFQRVGLDLKVTQLTPFIRSISGSDVEFEHVYDY